MRNYDNIDQAAQEADDHHTEFGSVSLPRVEIFGGNGCNYCIRAQELCKKFGLDYSYYNMDEDEERFDQLAARIKTWNTVPQIFWGPAHIGGYDDLAKKLGTTT